MQIFINNGETMDSIKLAAWTHAYFVKINPFIDGNSRTIRLIMNYQLMKNNYFPISIKEQSRFEYYHGLDNYATTGD